MYIGKVSPVFVRAHEKIVPIPIAIISWNTADAQIIVIVLFTYFIVFNIMGKDYDAAVLVAGTCGFGMGATPNAMANMQAVCDKYVPSVKAYLLIPLIGSLFADFLNSLVITFFINIL